jgi:hypothetical protein
MNISSVLFLLVAPAMFLMTSCTKQTSPAADNAKFVGTWNGYETCYYSNSLDTSIISPWQENIGVGSDGNSLNIGLGLGENSCYRATYLIAVVKSNAFSIAEQNFADNCGVGYMIGGTGSLNTAGTTLTMTTYQTSGSTTTCTFTGTKQ